MTTPLITSPAGVLTVLTGTCALFFFWERKTRWRVFQYLPPLIFIYLVPVLLSNTPLLLSPVAHWLAPDIRFTTAVLPTDSEVYDAIGRLVLPMMIVLLLLKVDVGAALRVMGRGTFVMAFGTAGVVFGAPVAYLLVRPWLGPEAWKAFGTLAGSWIGGTGNMAAVGEMIDTQGTEFGLAVLGDTTIYIVWLPLLLASKNLAERFGRFTGVNADRMARMEEAAKSLAQNQTPPSYQEYSYLLAIALAATWGTEYVAGMLPEMRPYLTENTWRILLVTTVGIALSFTPAKRVPGSHALAMALVYLFVAHMGATAELKGVARQAVPFLAAGLVWILIHGAFCLVGAKLFRVDVHTAAIASAANIGGAASAPIVAAYHKESLVPVSILMALIGYAVGNYAAYAAAILCAMLAP